MPFVDPTDSQAPEDDAPGMSSSAPLPSPPSVDTPPADLDEIRRGFSELAESQALDKAAALTITRLYHGIESILQHERNMRTRDVTNLRHELERTHMQMELDRLARRRTMDDVQMQTTDRTLSTPSHKRVFGR